jgi:hypothetical protein
MMIDALEMKTPVWLGGESYSYGHFSLEFDPYRDEGRTDSVIRRN